MLVWRFYVHLLPNVETSSDFFNPWTYKQIHTPTVVQRGGGGKMESLLWVFVVSQYSGKILPFWDFIFTCDVIYKMRYILCFVALWGLVTSSKMAVILAVTLDARHVEYDKVKHVVAFCRNWVFIHGKKVENMHFYI